MSSKINNKVKFTTEIIYHKKFEYNKIKCKSEILEHFCVYLKMGIKINEKFFRTPKTCCPVINILNLPRKLIKISPLNFAILK